jgi:hypothetical protein
MPYAVFHILHHAQVVRQIGCLSAVTSEIETMYFSPIMGPHGGLRFITFISVGGHIGGHVVANVARAFQSYSHENHSLFELHQDSKISEDVNHSL